MSLYDRMTMFTGARADHPEWESPSMLASTVPDRRFGRKQKRHLPTTPWQKPSPVYTRPNGSTIGYSGEP